MQSNSFLQGLLLTDMNPDRAIGIFANAQYFPCLAALINSIKYNNVDAEIKVYDYSSMNHLLKTYLQKHVTVIEVDSDIDIDGYFLNNWNWRPRVINQMYSKLAALEIFLDADMIVLNNLSEIYEYLKQGYFISSCESTYTYDKPDVNYKLDGKAWEKVIGIKNFNRTFDLYNSGFYCFNKKYHKNLISLWDQSSKIKRFQQEGPFYWDMWTFSLILDHERERGHVRIKNMTKNLWMNTWLSHKCPSKHLGFNNGKIHLFDSKTGEALGLYHYTGDIALPVGKNNILSRFYHSHKEDIVDNCELQLEETNMLLQRGWYDIWEKRHNSPAAMLIDYMYEQGPMKAPSTFSVDFRKKVARLLKVVLNNEGIHYNSKETYAVCIAYDYIMLLNYKVQHGDWLETPLKVLCDKDIYKGDKVLSWKRNAAITLDFGVNIDSRKHWLECSLRKSNHEFINSLNIDINP